MKENTSVSDRHATHRKLLLGRWISVALLAGVGVTAQADDTPPTQQDGGGGAATTLPDVNVYGPKPPRETTLGVSVGNANFGRNNTGREHNGNDGGKEKTEDKDEKTGCKDGAVSGNPVQLSTGNKIETELDFSGAGVRALYLERTWNQHRYEVGLFGYHWVSNFDYYLKFATDTATLCAPRPGVVACTTSSSATIAWAHRPDGRKIKFIKDASGTFWEEKAGPVARIVRETNGNWTLYSETNDVETYSAGGYLLTHKDEAGIGWTYTYGGLNSTQLQRVTHTNGRFVQFIWVGDELREVRDPAGNSYQYTYVNQKASDGYHNIGSTILPGSPVTTITYHYTDGAGNPGFSYLGGKSFNGVRYSTFTYNGGYATGTEHAGGVEKFTFAYTVGADNTLSVLETNPLGKQATYDFQNGKLLTVTGHASANCPLTGKGNTYDANGYRDVVTDENGNVTNYDYNAKGQLIKLVEASGRPEARTTTYTWDATKNRVQSITVAGHSKVTFAYDADARLASVTSANLSSNGVLNQTHTTTFSYTKHPSGLLATAKINGPLAGTGDEVTYTYSTAGDLIEERNSFGHVTSYSNHNALGLPGRITGPNGDITDFVYDARGRTAAVKRWINGTWQTTSYSFDGAGRLAKVQAPDGHAREFEYDAAWRLVREYEQEGGGVASQRRYTYNNASLVTRIDTERVSAPTSAPSITAPASSATGSYSVSWTTATDTTKYRLEESVNGGAWTQLVDALVTSKAISGKSNGSYSYRAFACNAWGCGPASTTATVAVSLSGPPATPALSVPSYNYGGSYVVSWTSTPGATSYRLEQNRNGGTWTEVYNGTGTSMGMSKTATAEFGYRVRACNADGCSAYSAVSLITVEVDRCIDC